MSPRMGRTGGSSARAFGKGTAVVRGPRGIPSVVSATATVGGLDLVWTNTDATAQTRIYNGATLLATANAAATTYSVTGLSGATAYTLTVKHYKDSVESAGSNFNSTTTSLAAPSNGSFTGDAVTSLTTSNTTLNWTNADAAANVYLYTDSVFVSNLGVNVTSTTQTGTLNTSYQYEVSAYKNGVESAKYNMGGAKTLAAYPSQNLLPYGGGTGINVPAGNISPPSTWNNSNNTVWVVGCGQAGQGANGGQGAHSSTQTNVTWNSAVAVVIAATTGDYTSFATTPSLQASWASGDRSGGSGGAGQSLYGGGGGGSGWAANVGTDGIDADSAIGPGQPHGGGDGGYPNTNGEPGSEGGGGGGRGGSGYSPGAGGAGCVRVIWGA